MIETEHHLLGRLHATPAVFCAHHWIHAAFSTICASWDQIPLLGRCSTKLFKRPFPCLTSEFYRTNPLPIHLFAHSLTPPFTHHLLCLPTHPRNLNIHVVDLYCGIVTPGVVKTGKKWTVALIFRRIAFRNGASRNCSVLLISMSHQLWEFGKVTG